MGSVLGWELGTGTDNVTVSTTKIHPSTWTILTSSLQPFSSEENLETTTDKATTPTRNSSTINTLTETNTTEETIIPYENITDLVSFIRGPAARRYEEEKKFEWSWDRWCQLQPRTGNCQQERTYFYYQAQSDTCREFTYTGCNGNENRFNTITDCERFCKGYGTEMETRSLKEVEACSLQPDPGNCLALMPRYYYDVNNGRCREFVFGGCGGNANRFVDKDECDQKCGGILQRQSKRAAGERSFIVPFIDE
ncbi:hypothetical protein O0L34_g5104 [Tuta absoluta]|nr:hypothetical protein O0L34_g5104 [Tuta absoluta]